VGHPPGPGVGDFDKLRITDGTRTGQGDRPAQAGHALAPEGVRDHTLFPAEALGPDNQLAAAPDLPCFYDVGMHVASSWCA